MEEKDRQEEEVRTIVRNQHHLCHDVYDPKAHGNDRDASLILFESFFYFCC